MNQPNQPIILIDTNLVFDIRSVVFNSIRLRFEKYDGGKIPTTDLQSQLLGLNINQSFNQILNAMNKGQQLAQEEKLQFGQLEPYLKQIFQSVKPKLPGFQVFLELKDLNKRVYLFSRLEKEYINIISEKYSEFQFVTIDQAKKIIDDGQKCFLISQAADEQHIPAETTSCKVILVKNSKKLPEMTNNCRVINDLYEVQWEDLINSKIKKQNEEALTKVQATNLSKDISITQLYKYWDQFYQIKGVLPVKFKSQVIHGKKIGSKQLGIPTANMQNNDNISAKIQNLIAGVYCGDVKVLGKEYIGAISIGYNPTFNNKDKSIVCKEYICLIFVIIGGVCSERVRR